jgi:aryl-phospho-beta-D-glucosidase BglC (GH1 family)
VRRLGRVFAAALLVAAVGVVVWAVSGRHSGGPSSIKPPPPTPRLTIPGRASGLVAPWVTTRGAHFVDRRGQPVVLRGFDVAVGNQPVYQTAPMLGANFVRIYASWSQIEARAPTDHGRVHHWDQALLASLDQEVQFYRSARVNVLIDFHQFHWSPWYAQTECKPGATVCKASGVPAWFYQGRYGQDKGSESRAKAAFWTTESRESLYDYGAFVEMMVKRYGRYPNVMGYEVFNEPHTGMLADDTATTNLVLRWQGRIAQVIHALDPNRTVFIMGRGGGEGIGTADLGLVPGPHVALDFHDYFNGHPGYGLDAQGDNWAPSWPATHNQDAVGPYTGTQAAQAAVLKVPIERAHRFHMPLLVGEWGIHTATPNSQAYQQQMASVMAANGVSWARWNLASDGRFALLDGRTTPSPEALQLQQFLAAP